MRIISQNGKWDLPYDMVAIDRCGANIFAQSNLISSSDDNYIEIAEYSTPEKAEKAMEMLHEEFLSYMQLQGGIGLMQGSVSVAPNIWVLPKIFKFPSDEEIKVNSKHDR